MYLLVFNIAILQNMLYIDICLYSLNWLGSDMYNVDGLIFSTKRYCIICLPWTERLSLSLPVLVDSTHTTTSVDFLLWNISVLIYYKQCLYLKTIYKLDRKSKKVDSISRYCKRIFSFNWVDKIEINSFFNNQLLQPGHQSVIQNWSCNDRSE